MILSSHPHREGGFRAARPGPAPVYAVGDIHGRYDLLIELLAQIAEDVRDTNAAHPAKLVFLGDYVDRGPDSARVLEALARLRERGAYDLTCLKGNHEAAMLTFLDDPSMGRDWIRFGGGPTLVAYGVPPPSADDPLPVFIAAREALSQSLPPSHLGFLRSLVLQAEAGDYAFVHAGVRPGVPLADQSEEDLLWIRDDFIADLGPHPKVIVHGHTWTDDQPRLLQHRIGVDTGAYRTGVLTAVRLAEGDIRIIQARGEAAAAATEPEGAAALQSQW